MTVSTDRFVAAMSDHWTNALGNTTSPKLQAIWRQLADVWNEKIESYGTPEYARWKVLQPKTGTGKTQGLAVYCSMLPRGYGAPGVLIVTRLKDEAEVLVNDINRLAGEEIAERHNSSYRVPAGIMRNKEVLVITHEAFRIGLDQVNKGDITSSNWEILHDLSPAGPNPKAGSCGRAPRPRGGSAGHRP